MNATDTPRGQTVNSEYYSKVINIIITFEINEVASMDELKEKIQETDICINNICITLSKKFFYLDILAFRN